MDKVQFDFGNDPVLFAWLTRNPGWIGVFGVSAIFLTLPIGGWVGGMAVAIAVVNDFAYAIRNPGEPLTPDDESPDVVKLPTQPADNLVNPFTSHQPKDSPRSQLDLIQHLTSKPLDEMKSLIVLGESGVGKGLFVERWKNAILQRFPNASLFAVNGKPDKRESHRWQGFKQVLDVKSEADAHKAINALERIAAALENRLDSPSDIPFILIMDELNTIMDFWTKEEATRAITLIKRIARQGRSLRCWLVLTLQSPNVDDLGISASDRTNFVLVALGYRNFQGVIRLAANNSSLFPGLPGRVSKDLASHKGKEYGIALCSDMDEVLQLPPTDPRAKLEHLLQQDIPEPTHSSQLSNTSKPNLSQANLLLTVAELLEWLSKTGETDPAKVYTNWKGKRHGFTRPEIRYLLAIIDSLPDP